MKTKIINKSFHLLEITKDDDMEYDIKAVITTFGNMDKVGDIMEKGCLDKFLERFNKGETDVIRMLFNHNRDKILGKWVKFEIMDDKVIGYGKMSEVTMAKDIKMLIKDEILKEVSIGFRAKEYSYREDDDKYFMPMNFKEIELYETSIVDTPANDKAEILESKDLFIDMKYLERTLRENGFSKKQSKTIVSSSKKILKIEEQEQRDVVASENLEILNAIKGLKLKEINHDRNKPNIRSY